MSKNKGIIEELATVNPVPLDELAERAARLIPRTCHLLSQRRCLKELQSMDAAKAFGPFLQVAVSTLQEATSRCVAWAEERKPAERRELLQERMQSHFELIAVASERFRRLIDGRMYLSRSQSAGAEPIPLLNSEEEILLEMQSTHLPVTFQDWAAEMRAEQKRAAQQTSGSAGATAPFQEAPEDGVPQQHYGEAESLAAAEALLTPQGACLFACLRQTRFYVDFDDLAEVEGAWQKRSCADGRVSDGTILKALKRMKISLAGSEFDVAIRERLGRKQARLYRLADDVSSQAAG